MKKPETFSAHRFHAEIKIFLDLRSLLQKSDLKVNILTISGTLHSVAHKSRTALYSLFLSPAASSAIIPNEEFWCWK